MSAYFMVGMTVAAFRTVASASRHRLVIVFSCVKNCNVEREKVCVCVCVCRHFTKRTEGICYIKIGIVGLIIIIIIIIIMRERSINQCEKEFEEYTTTCLHTQKAAQEGGSFLPVHQPCRRSSDQQGWSACCP